MPTASLENIADGSDINAAPHRNNYAEIQTILNGLDADNIKAGALANDWLFKALVSGDTQPRLAIQADGSLVFGSGAVAGDVALLRAAADVLGLPAGDGLELLEAAADLAVPPANGLRLYAKDDGVGNTGLYIRFADGSVYKIIADGGGSDIVGGAGATNYRKVTAKTVPGTTTAYASPGSDLLAGEITLPANVLSTNKRARIQAEGTWVHAASSDLAVKVSLGGTTIWEHATVITAGAGVIDTGRTNRWLLDLWLTNLNATNVQSLVGLFELMSTAPTTGQSRTTPGSSNAPDIGAAGTVDTTADRLLELHVKYGSSNGSNSFTLTSCIVEII